MISSHRSLVVPGALLLLVAMFVLGWGLTRQHVAAAYSDPVAHIRAQDESQYVHASLQMARGAGWLTPRFLGRFYLLKPPLLLWATGLSVRIFGENAFAIRFSALLLGVIGCAALYLWASRRSLAAALLAASLLMLDPLWGILSRLCYTDTISAALSAVALLAPALDPKLERMRTRLGFGLFAGLSILDKGISGLIPCLALLLYWTLAKERPRLAYVVQSLACAALVALPWHLYQLAVHREWFLAEYVQTQILASGVFGTEAGIFNRPAFFYVQRLFELDPLAALLGLLALAGIFRTLRRREDASTLLAVCWLTVSALAVAAFQVKNLPYLAMVLPSICLVAALCAEPWLERLGAPRAALLLAAVLAVKILSPGHSWSLRPPTAPLPGAGVLRAYYGLNRNTELIEVDPDDEYYGSTLPLPKLRYVYLDPTGGVARSAPHNAYLGITLTQAQFLDLPRLEPEFVSHLTAWGLASSEPIGTTLTVSAIADLAELIRHSPQRDFYLPESWLPPEEAYRATHELRRVSPGRIFLLSRDAGLRPFPHSALPPW